MPTETETTGLSLKVERVSRRVKQQDLASAMGVSASRVASIEREGFVTAATAKRYLEALDTCATSRTSAVS
jgi:transcriptional regulator with XRE-family HTH domain